jgi:ATP-dependent DNA helicase RecG
LGAITSIINKSQTKLDLSTPVQYLKGAGPVRAKIFAQLGVHTAEDLLQYYPRDWIFAPQTKKIIQMRPAQTKNTVNWALKIFTQSLRPTMHSMKPLLFL